MMPILFSTPMVRAILDGCKTQTRRIVKPQPKLLYRLTGDRISLDYSHDENYQRRDLEADSCFSELRLHGGERWGDLLPYKVCGLWEEGFRGLVSASWTPDREGVLDILAVPQQQESDHDGAPARVHGVSRDAKVQVDADSAPRREPGEQQTRKPCVGHTDRELAGPRSTRARHQGGKAPQREVLEQRTGTHTVVREDGLVQPKTGRSYFGSGPSVRVRDCPFKALTKLWVQETWCEIPPERPAGYFTDPKWIGRRAWYSADNDKPTWGGRWQSPCRMPRWASRITLKVSSVRAQRVQDISEEDARAEGATCSCAGGFSGVGWDNTPLECERCSGCGSFADLFALQWNEIHGPGAWERNDWVWAIDFEREAVKA